MFACVLASACVRACECAYNVTVFVNLTLDNSMKNGHVNLSPGRWIKSGLKGQKHAIIHFRITL